MNKTARSHVFSLAGLLFLLSGATSLAYEVVWVKLLTLELGSAAWSIATVLACFMAGLGGGSAWAGRRADRFRRPLQAYGLIELAIALFGFISAPLLERTMRLLDPLYGLIDGYFPLFLAAQFLLTFIALILPTFLMGASLPLLITALTHDQTFRQHVALLYGVNTLGAALGTFVTGIVLLPALGISNTLWVAVGVGGGVAAGALWLDRQLSERSNSPPSAEKHLSVQRLPHLLLFAIGLAGTLGVGYQIAWTRLLVPVVGSSVYAFTIILTTVLLGIGVGALLAALPQLRQVSYQRAVALTMGIGACSAIAGLFAVNLLPELFAVMAQRFGERTWLLFMAQGALTACVLFVPACSLGAALPLGIAAWRHAAGSAGWAVGGMYAMNTLGAILGSLLAGFFLLPLLGATHLVLGGAALGIAAAVALLLSQPSARRSRAWLQAGALVALFACSVATVPETDITQLQRGIFRGIHHNTGLSEIKTVLLHAEEGTSATVTVFRTPNSTVLKVNGKADASTGGDVDTQYLIGHIPLFLHPTPGSACIIGYGSGATVHAVSTHPQIQSIDVVEIEQAVLNASRYFHSINFNVLHDPRVHLFLEDGRNFLQRREATYDIIISQPSNPWIAGISSLFTTEYYQAVKERINRGGLFCQWIQTYEISASTRQVMLQTLTSVFPYVTVFSIDGDLICLAAKQPLRGSAALYAERLAVEAVRRSLDRIQINDAFDLFASAYTQYPTERVPFSSSTRNTDDNLWLEYRAPIEMYRGTNEPLAPVRLEVFVPVIRQLFPDLSTEELISNTARSIARRYPERWYVLDEWARSSEQPPALARDLRRRSKDAQARHEALSQNGERFTRANALARARRYSDAVPLYEAILATDPRDGAAHRMLAWSLTRLGHGNRAWTHYQQAIDLNVDDFEALTNMAALALSSGKQEGVDLLERALQTNPHYGTAYRIYLQFLRDQRQFEQAQSILQRAHRYLGEEERSQLEQIVASAQ